MSTHTSAKRSGLARVRHRSPHPVLVAGMAGAASFTHVHDWTMHNSPAGTGNWFGWANAMVSELIPWPPAWKPAAASGTSAPPASTRSS